jgi:hypothetical protein
MLEHIELGTMMSVIARSQAAKVTAHKTRLVAMIYTSENNMNLFG